MKNKKDTKLKVSYEPEADVLTYEVSRQPVDYAREVGNVVVHFNKKNEPVLFEILEARKFLAAAENLMASKSEDRLLVGSSR